VRGESAYLLEARIIISPMLRRGWEPRISRLMRPGGRRALFLCEIGIDTVATIVNDLITCGALPVSVAMHAAVGDSSWFADEARAQHLVEGFAEGCRQAGAVWVAERRRHCGGSWRRLPSSWPVRRSADCAQELRITGDVHDGDRNHFSRFLGRADERPHALPEDRGPASARLPDAGRRRTHLRRALLAPSVIYVAFVRECQRRGSNHTVASRSERRLMRTHEPSAA